MTKDPAMLSLYGHIVRHNTPLARWSHARFASERMTARRVDKAVGSVKNDDPSLVQAV